MKTLYQCEVCGTVYKLENLAQRCEAVELPPPGIRVGDALPNKFAGREIVIVGDRKKRQVNGDGKLFLVTLPPREDQIQIEAENREEARQEVLRRFKKTRLPRGSRIELAA